VSMSILVVIHRTQYMKKKRIMSSSKLFSFTTRLTAEESVCTGSCKQPLEVLAFCSDCIESKWVRRCFGRHTDCKTTVFDSRIPDSTLYSCCAEHAPPVTGLDLVVKLFETQNDLEPTITYAMKETRCDITPAEIMQSLYSNHIFCNLWEVDLPVSEWANKNRNLTVFMRFGSSLFPFCFCFF
jgi:hypothetical protein